MRLSQQPSRQQQQATQEQQADQIQPQPEEAQPGVDPEIPGALTKSPKLRAALEQDVQRLMAAQQQARWSQQQYAYATHEAAKLAATMLVADYPELNGLNNEQLGIALQLMSVQNPQKHSEITARLARVQNIYNVSQAAQQQAQQIAHTNWQDWGAISRWRLRQ